MKKLRWLFLSCALILIIQTPWAIAPAIQEVKADHKLIPVSIGALSIRIAFIWGFFYGWWKQRSGATAARK
jgi:hypothetical protein